MTLCNGIPTTAKTQEECLIATRRFTRGNDTNKEVEGRSSLLQRHRRPSASESLNGVTGE